MKHMSAAEVRKAVEQAFAHSQYPGDDRIVYDTTGGNLEAQQVAAYFRGKTWREVDLPFIRGYDEFADASACLSFMTPEAFRYYLPAFLLIVINAYEDVGLIVDTTISRLAPWPDQSDKMMTDFMQERLSGFTAAQRQAVRAFLEHVRDVHADELSVDEIDRALHYWT